MNQSMNVETENFELIFETSNKKVMNNLRVATLSRVISVDKDSRTISVQPIVQEKINCDSEDGYKYIKLPVIKNVPYISGNYPKVNDYVVCIHLDRTKSGINLLTDTTSFIESNVNRHNLNDCVAVVINTKDEWTLIGGYTSTESDIDVSNYSEFKAILLNNSSQISQQLFTPTTEVSSCILSDSTNNSEFSIINNKLEIGSLSQNCKLLIYGR